MKELEKNLLNHLITILDTKMQTKGSFKFNQAYVRSLFQNYC